MTDQTPVKLSKMRTRSAALENFDRVSANIRSANFKLDPDIMGLADQAAACMDAHVNDDTDDWAKRLAGDFIRLGD
jgi:hypothetical protein